MRKTPAASCDCYFPWNGAVARPDLSWGGSAVDRVVALKVPKALSRNRASRSSSQGRPEQRARPARESRAIRHSDHEQVRHNAQPPNGEDRGLCAVGGHPKSSRSASGQLVAARGDRSLPRLDGGHVRRPIEPTSTGRLLAAEAFQVVGPARCTRDAQTGARTSDQLRRPHGWSTSKIQESIQQTPRYWPIRANTSRTDRRTKPC